jgi:tetratricopeptide (TPR) repeat protein
VAWKQVESQGGIVPDIEEDATQSPPAWWRYPSALRSALLLEAESQSAAGLYSKVDPAQIAKGDLLVRTEGAGACGKMAVLAAKIQDRWTTVEAREEDDDDAPSGPGSPSSDFFHADQITLQGGVRVFRIRVKNESTLGHVRELRRDLDHLERTLGQWPPLLARAPRARDVVDDKLHDLLDEAWSLVADTSYDDDRRELAGRTLALAAGLGWLGAAEGAVAVLDDVIARPPVRPDALTARAMIALLLGDKERSLGFAEKAAAATGAAPRAELVRGRALLALGRGDEASAAFRRAVAADPRDYGARRELEAPHAVTPPGPPPSRGLPLQFRATRDTLGLAIPGYGLSASWPLTWRVVGLSATEENGALVNFATGRVLLDDGAADRGSAVLFVQRPSPAERASLVKAGAKKIFPEARLKRLTALVPGSKRESFKEGRGAEARAGEVTTIERDGVVAFLVLNAPAEVYPKLADDYALFVKSLAIASPAP